MKQSSYSIAVLGLWHLGEIYSAGLAELGHHVCGVSDDKQVVSDFMKSAPPLPEPGLEALLLKNISAGRLSYTGDFKEIKNSNVIWITHDTPIDDNDNADTSVIFESLKKVLPYAQDGVLMVVTSQIPVGTSKEIKKYIRERRPDLKYGYVYSPENLRLGDAVNCFLKPSRVVIGADAEEDLKKAEEIFLGLNTEILKMSTASAEMSKHALNAFLATSISFMGDIADICEKVGADVLDVTRALRSDPRVGQKAPLEAGLGFSGGTLARDLKALYVTAKNHGIEAPVIESILEKNFKRKDIVIRRLEEHLGTLKGKTITILGLTYKPGTRTLRRSVALEIEQDMRRSGALLRLHDPQALPEESAQYTNSVFYRDTKQAAAGAHALVLITPWPEFRTLEFEKLGARMKPPAVFFDTCNFLYAQRDAILRSGFTYISVGR